MNKLCSFFMYKDSPGPEKPVYAAKSVNEKTASFNEEMFREGIAVNRISEKYSNGDVRIIIAAPFSQRVILGIVDNKLDCYVRRSNGSRQDVCPHEFMKTFGAHPEIRPDIDGFLEKYAPVAQENAATRHLDNP